MMNKLAVENTQGSEALLETISLGLAPGEIILGSLIAIDAAGNPQVSFPQIANTHSLIAVSTIAVSHQHVGRQVALLFANGDPQKPIIIGLIHSPLFDLLENFSMLQNVEVSTSEVPDNDVLNSDLPDSENDLPDIDPFDGNKVIASKSVAPLETIHIDGKRVVIEGQEEVVLSCGESSITLTKAGKILIRGKYLVSRSSGVNRILGGSVQVN
ncbi:MAG: DUF6484 domain-containing protein [Pseudomonadota bacterium]